MLQRSWDIPAIAFHTLIMTIIGAPHGQRDAFWIKTEDFTSIKAKGAMQETQRRYCVKAV